MQHDGAIAHMAGESLACLQQNFGDRLISHGTEFPFTSHSPNFTAQMPTYGACRKNPFSDQMTHMEMFPNYGRRYSHFVVSLQQPVFISMSNNLKDSYEHCVRREGIHF